MYVMSNGQAIDNANDLHLAIIRSNSLCGNGNVADAFILVLGGNDDGDDAGTDSLDGMDLASPPSAFAFAIHPLHTKE
jgi:hypothetical protein